MSRSRNGAPALLRTFSILGSANTVYPYNEVVNHAELQRFCNYRVAKDDRFIHYWDERFTGGVRLGWKLHILITPESMSRVWDKLFPLFRCEGINSFKIRHPHFNADSHKEVTIYQFANPEKSENDWHDFVRKIEKIMVDESCQPGSLPPANKMIVGSKFISYRNDSHVDGTYITDAKAAEFAARNGLDASNLNGVWDPFSSLNLSSGHSQPFFINTSSK